ncbi:MAG: hypothetical protein JW837_00495 [Sedimentisphaerales bacterium]|nr:hypothetical protein [Sedimentisphaerales bacterium]
MNEEEIKKILNGSYDDSKEDTICSMLGDFYNRKMLSVVIFVWVWAIVLIAGAFYSGIKFYKYAGDVRFIYALVFIVCIQGISIIKIFAWQMIHKNSIKREIKRLELRIAELNETVKSK